MTRAKSIKESKELHKKRNQTRPDWSMRDERGLPRDVVLTQENINHGLELLENATPRPWSTGGIFSPNDPQERSTLLYGPIPKGKQSGPAVFPNGRFGLTIPDAEAIAFAVNFVGAALYEVMSLRSDLEIIEQSLNLVSLHRDPWALGTCVEFVDEEPPIGAIQPTEAGFVPWRCVVGSLLLFQAIGCAVATKELAIQAIEVDYQARYGRTPAEAWRELVDSNRALAGLEPTQPAAPRET